MIKQNVKWKKTFENSESNSNIIIDNDCNLIIYYNHYVDNILRERKIGNLISISSSGDINWTFSFPDYNYLYFKENIILDNNNLYLIADSNQQYDSGFERGLYVFNVNGNYEKHYCIEQIINKEVVIPIFKSELIELGNNKNNDYEFDKISHVKSINKFENNVYYTTDNGAYVNLYCL